MDTNRRDASTTHAPPSGNVTRWMAVASLAVGAFATVTTEFLPIGLLPDIAASLGVSEGIAGLMVTMPGIIAALAGPALIVASGRLDRRVVLVGLTALLVVANLLGAVAQNFTTMLVARMLLGLCVGGFWTFAPAATGRMVGPTLQARAMSYVLAGISVATVAGVPAGSFLGSLAGWRMVFAVAAGIAMVVLVCQLRFLPAMPPERAMRGRDLLLPLESAPTRQLLLVGFLLVAGHFAAYTYLTPLLRDRFGLSVHAVTMLLLVYGGSGFIGTFIGGRAAERSARWTIVWAAVVIAGVLLFAAVVGDGMAGGAAVALIWGGAFGFVPVAFTAWMQAVSGEAAEAGQASLVCVFQIAIAVGSTVGGRVFDGHGLASAILIAAALCAVAAPLAARRLSSMQARTVCPEM